MEQAEVGAPDDGYKKDSNIDDKVSYNSVHRSILWVCFPSQHSLSL